MSKKIIRLIAGDKVILWGWSQKRGGKSGIYCHSLVDR